LIVFISPAAGNAIPSRVAPPNGSAGIPS